jgi:hypothetical protein
VISYRPLAFNCASSYIFLNHPSHVAQISYTKAPHPAQSTVKIVPKGEPRSWGQCCFISEAPPRLRIVPSLFSYSPRRGAQQYCLFACSQLRRATWALDTNLQLFGTACDTQVGICQCGRTWRQGLRGDCLPLPVVKPCCLIKWA